MHRCSYCVLCFKSLNGIVQRNDTGNEDPAAIYLEEAKEKTEYYEEGDGGATD